MNPDFSLVTDGALNRWTPWLAAAGILANLVYLVWTSPQIFVACLILGLLWEELTPRQRIPFFSHEKATAVRYNLFNWIVMWGFGNALAQFCLRHLGQISVPHLSLNAAGVSVWTQALVLLIVFDFKNYWLHRLAHGWTFLWRLHRIHHSPTELSIISVRDHAYYWIEKAATTPLLAMFLGVSIDAYVYMMTVWMTITTLTHLNISFQAERKRLPWWNYIVVTPHYHCWHHTYLCGYNKNLSDVFTLWDVLFGTWETPQSGSKDWKFGLEPSQRLPNSVVLQFFSPLQRGVPTREQPTQDESKKAA